MAVYGGGNAGRRDAPDRHPLLRRARVPPRAGQGGERPLCAAGAARRQPRRREPGARARKRCALDAQRELCLGVRVLPDEHIRQRGERILRYAPGSEGAEAREQKRESSRLLPERHFRRGARGVRKRGARGGRAGNGRRSGERFARGHKSGDRLGAGRAARRGRRNPRQRLTQERAMKAGWLVLALARGAPARAQEPFPQKGSIEITVLFPAGSSADVTARLLADGMSKNLGGAKVIVFNRPGAGGAIGYKHVASQKADGYSVVWNSNSISRSEERRV